MWYTYICSMNKRSRHAVCKNCNKEFDYHSSSWGIYCSLKCQHEYIRKSNILKWLDGKITSLNTNGIVKPFIRKYIFKLFDNKCMFCGWNKTNKHTNLIPLEIDHIDGNHNNNDISNLRVLCPNCHSLTSTYKNSNKGKGRQKR